MGDGRLKRAARWLRLLARLFAALYLLALLLWATGTYGWFGQDQDPLAGVFLIPLGFPWNVGVEGLVGALLAPAVNLFLILVLARWMRTKATGRG